MLLDVMEPWEACQYPPRDELGNFDIWKGLSGGMVALEKSGAVEAIDCDHGSIISDRMQQTPTGIEVLSMNVQSLRGPLDKFTKRKQNVVKGIDARTKRGIVLAQIAQRKAHLAGMQEARPFKTGERLLAVFAYVSRRQISMQHMSVCLQ